MYAFGVILQQLFWEKMAFMDQCTNELTLRNYVKSGGRPNVEFVSRVEQRMQSLVRLCWHQGARKRPTMQVVIGKIERKHDRG